MIIQIRLKEEAYLKRLKQLKRNGDKISYNKVLLNYYREYQPQIYFSYLINRYLERRL